MNSFLVELRPKKSEFDPMSRRIRAEIEENGCPPKDAEVMTERLFKISGHFSLEQMKSICDRLLVDPVVEKANVIDLKNTSSKPKKSLSKGWVLDIWPKPGVTDPVAESVIKGLRDLGYKGDFEALSAQRFIFPHVRDSRLIKEIAQKFLSNPLIHDINIEQHH